MAKTLLLIEDDELTRGMLAMLLEEDGWDVQQAERGEEALAKLPQRSSPDVVLSDLNLPGIAKADLARELRSKCGSRTRLIAMTATLKEGSGAGFDAVLQKPVDAKALEAVLNGSKAAPQPADDVELDETVYQRFFDGMKEKTGAFYNFALQDMEKRAGKMQDNLREKNAAGLRSTAHALKGGAAMSGAVRVARLAAQLEMEGIKADTHATIAHLQEALQSLKLILVSKEKA